MNWQKSLIPVTIFIIILITGCSQSYLRQGERALSAKQYVQALEHLEQALIENPNNAETKYCLGRVYYHLNNYHFAEQYLTEAQDELADNSNALLYLGLLKEAQEKPAAAIAVYEKFLNLHPKVKAAREVRGRLLYLKNDALRSQVKEALTLEKSLSASSLADNSVGVMPFLSDAEANASQKAIAVGLGAALWYDLSQVNELQLVERQHVKYLLDEIKIADAGFVEEESTPRVGKLVGAMKLINGNISESVPNQLDVQSGIVNTANKYFAPAYLGSSEFSKIVEMQKNITFAVIDSLGVTLTSQQKVLLGKPLTKSLQAFIAFGHGIAALDSGSYESAISYFEQAVQIDGEFDLAKSFLDESGLLQNGTISIHDFENNIFAYITPSVDIIRNWIEEPYDIIKPVGDPRDEDTPTSAGSRGTVSIGGSIR